tara:strand:+ start:388 stop:762 length:375 start_codon:yes stop_codon:yes gene_type:complete
MKCPMCGSYLDDDGLCGECDVSDILDFAGRKEMEDQYTLTGLDTLTIGSDIDPVNKPIHYTNSKLECIEIIEALAEHIPAEYVPHVTNIMKYLFRFPKKNGLEDIDKLDWYVQRLRKKWVEKHK